MLPADSWYQTLAKYSDVTFSAGSVSVQQSASCLIGVEALIGLS